MPGIQCDWIKSPLTVVKNTLESHCPDDYQEKVAAFFGEQLSGDDIRKKIPSLNSTALHTIQPNSLVHCRCMIQDMFGPEYYYDSYTAQTSTGEKLIRSGRFQDVFSNANGDVLLESEPQKTMERQVFYCVPVPGESEWVKQGHKNKCFLSSSAESASVSVNTKRTLEEDADDTMDVEPPAEQIEASKRSRTQDNGPSGFEVSNQQQNLSFPLPEEKGPACLVKIYDNTESLKLNDVVDVFGVISLDPALSQLNHDDEMVSQKEQNAHHPPASLVPRLHVVAYDRLVSVNPLLINQRNQQANVEALLPEVKVIREHLLSLLEQMLCGDTLAAEYLLCHLLSSVYLRKDTVAIGKLSLNFTKLPADKEFNTFMLNFIQSLVPSYYYLPMTLDNMNKMRFIPCKDYEADKLVSGILQLPERFNLILDETAMQAGQLDEKGVSNLTALGNLIRWQKVSYDFKYHQQEFLSDVEVLVLSDGKSLLPSDVQVELRLNTDMPLSSRHEAIQTYLHDDLLNKIRFYLSVAPWVDYKLSNDMQKIVQEDFVAIRQESKDAMTIDDFHSLLVVARLLSISGGLSELTPDVWERAKTMESERKQRLVK